MSINRIETAYELVAEDKQLLRLHFNNRSKDWDKKELKPVKKRIVKYLKGEQEKRCCYCKIKFRRRKQNIDIEHIVPKKRHPKFTFHPMNLALSCKACNSSKNQKKPFSDETITDSSLSRLPYTKGAYKIVHPHYDEYDENIQILDGILIHSVSEKGDETVRQCCLHEAELAIDKAYDIVNDEHDVKGLFMRLVKELPNDGFDEEDDIFDRLEEILDVAEEDI